MNKPQTSYNSYTHKLKKIRHSVPLIGSIKPDLDLLKILIEKQSPSNSQEEKQFTQWLAKYCTDKGYKVEKDSHRNIYVTKGSAKVYPCIVAHTDTNQDLHSSLELVQIGDLLIGWNKITAQQCGAGFDDKVGILIALQCLEIFDNLKVFFPSLEEVGYIGSSKSNIKFFDDVGYCFQPDRNSGNNDICTYTNGTDTASDDFIDALDNILKMYEYKESTGVGTDIGELKWRGLKCSAVNVSCGYFREHNDDEVCSVSLLHNCLNFIVSCIDYLGETRFDHEVDIKRRVNKGYAGVYDYYEGFSKDYGDEFLGVELNEDLWYTRVKGELVLATPNQKYYLQYEYCPDCVVELDVLSWNDAQDIVQWRCPHCNAKYVNAYVDNQSDKANQNDW